MIFERVNKDISLGYLDGFLYWTETRCARAIVNEKAGWVREDGYRFIRFNNKLIRSHRIIWEMFNGNIPHKKCIDHIDGNPLNNKISNLRLCTTNQNMHNSKKGKANTSGVKGVSWNPVLRKWIAQIMSDRKYYHLGCFDDIDVAAQVVRIKRIELHKEFARHE